MSTLKRTQPQSASGVDVTEPAPPRKRMRPFQHREPRVTAIALKVKIPPPCTTTKKEPVLKAHYPSTSLREETAIIKAEVFKSERVDALRKAFPLPTRAAVPWMDENIHDLKVNKALFVHRSVQQLARECFPKRKKRMTKAQLRDKVMTRLQECEKGLRRALLKDKVMAWLQECEDSQEEVASGGWDAVHDGVVSVLL
jgi:hypothetical protein